MAIKITPKKKKTPAAKSPTAGTITSDGVVSDKTKTVAKTAKPAPSTAAKVSPVVQKSPKKATATAPAKKKLTVTAIKKAILPYCRPVFSAKVAYEESKKVTDKLKKAYDAELKKVSDTVANIDMDPDFTLKVDDGNSAIAFGVAQVSRTVVSQRDVFNELEKIDPELPWKLLSFKITDIEKYLPKTVADKLVTVTQTDKRTLTVTKSE